MASANNLQICPECRRYIGLYETVILVPAKRKTLNQDTFEFKHLSCKNVMAGNTNPNIETKSAAVRIVENELDMRFNELKLEGTNGAYATDN